MTSGTVWCGPALTANGRGGVWVCARNKTEMLSINGMRWYMAMALECNSMVVDTMSCRGMVTHEKRGDRSTRTLYRTVLHCLDGPALEDAFGVECWYADGKLQKIDIRIMTNSNVRIAQ